MPSFLVPNAQHCRDFLSHPNAFVVHIPTGDDLYFTLPFDLSSLHPMRPQELEALYGFLDKIQDEVAESLGNHTLDNVRQAQLIISRWLKNARSLGDLEKNGWAAGLGFPVFDDFQFPVDFYWDWDTIAFEGLSSRYSKLVDLASTSFFHYPIYRTLAEYASAPPNTPVNRSLHTRTEQDYMNPDSVRPVSTYGATFANTNDGSEFCHCFSDLDSASVQDEIFQFEGDSNHGIGTICKPNVAIYPMRDEQASTTNADTIEPTKIQQHTIQPTVAAKKHSVKIQHIWEDFYQRGLISYGLTAETNSLVPYADLYLLKLYKAMRDQGLSDSYAMQEIRYIKWTDPSSFPERSVWHKHSRQSGEESTCMFSNGVGCCTPQMTVEEAIAHCHPEEYTEEYYILPRSPTEQVQDPGQGSEHRVRFTQPLSDQEAEQCKFIHHAAPRVVHYTQQPLAHHPQQPLAHHQSATFHRHNSVLPSGSKREQTTGVKTAKKLSESKKKERNRFHSNSDLQNTTQQTDHFRDYEQRISTAQENIVKLKHDLQTLYDQVSNHVRTAGGDSNASRTVSFQEPTRLCIRPRATARPSSHHAGLRNSKESESHKPSHQAYAEDSPEDSPGAKLGSWRDV